MQVIDNILTNGAHKHTYIHAYTFLKSASKECFRTTMPKALKISYLNFLFIFPNEFKLHTQTQQIIIKKNPSEAVLTKLNN